jgi:hypothetical protein
MAKIVKPHPRQILHLGHQHSEFVGQAAWLHRRSIGPGAGQRIAALSDPKRQQIFGLLVLQPA